VILALLVSVLPSGPASAGERGFSYRCELVATKRGTEITIALKLVTNEPRADWRIRLFHEGERVFSKVRRTNAEGRLTVVRVEPNLPGRDDLLARARHVETGEICTVQSRI
jgi:hypothetical protein